MQNEEVDQALKQLEAGFVHFVCQGMGCFGIFRNNTPCHHSALSQQSISCLGRDQAPKLPSTADELRRLPSLPQLLTAWNPVPGDELLVFRERCLFIFSFVPSQWAQWISWLSMNDSPRPLVPVEVLKDLSSSPQDSAVATYQYISPNSSSITRVLPMLSERGSAWRTRTYSLPSWGAGVGTLSWPALHRRTNI